MTKPMMDKPLAYYIDEMLAGKTKLLDSLSPEERIVLKSMMEEYSKTGRSSIEEHLWMVDYKERPPTPKEFLYNTDYLGFVVQERSKLWKRDLEYVLSPTNEITEWVLDGAIGIGKTTSAVTAILYKMALLFLLKDPASYFGLLPGSPIVIGLFNIYKYLTDDTAYNMMLTYMRMSPFFQDITKAALDNPRKDQYQNLPNNVGIIIGASALHALGMNVIGGLLDEANFKKMIRSGVAAREMTQMFELYSGIQKRITSRFHKPVLLCLASSSRNEFDFTDAHKELTKGNPRVYHSRYAIYHIKEKYFGEETFTVFIGDRMNRPKVVEEGDTTDYPKEMLEDVPVSLKELYELNLEESVRDLSGRSIPSAGRLIPDVLKIHDCIDDTRENPFREDTIQIGVLGEANIEDFFTLDQMFQQIDVAGTIYRPLYHPMAVRYLHADLAENQCAAGLVCVCPCGSSLVPRFDPAVGSYMNEELIVHFDFLLRIKNEVGDRIDFAKIRRFIIYLRSRGLPIGKVTFDSYQSRDSINLLTQAGFISGLQSVDTTIEPYNALRNAIIERRAVYPRHEVFLSELESLKRVGDGLKEKVVKGEYGSKDVADAAAGAVFTLTQNATGAIATSRPEVTTAIRMLRAGKEAIVEPVRHPYDTIFKRGG